MVNPPTNTRSDFAPYRQITLGNGADPAIAVLLVEDNAGDVRLLQEFLGEVASTRFELIHTDRLDNAIACLAQNRFDIVLLDLSLPDSQGLDTFLELHRQAPGLPIIVLTGLDDETLAIKAMHEGAQDYLPKGQVDGHLLGRSIRYAIERQRSEEALRDSEARYRSVVLAMQEGIILQQADGTILTCNTSAERILALPVAEILGHTSCDLSWRAVHEDGSPFPCESYPAMVTLQTGQPCSNVVLGIHRHDDGALTWIAMNSQPLFYPGESLPYAVITSFTDITEKKQLEAQFLHAQRLESLGTLAGGIAHDLNNILTPILGVVQLLPLKLPNLDPRTQNLINLLETSAQRGVDLVKQILSFTRGIEGKPNLVKVQHLIAEIRQIIQQTFPKSIELSIDLPQDLWTISVDGTQLHQVFMNFCINARDAMPQGGILSISAENFWADENYARMNLDARVGPYVAITFTDTGTGIAPEILDRVFDPFFTTKKIGEGTGLGLATVMGILKNHRGFLKVESEVGKGTRFQIYLPAAESVEIQPEVAIAPLGGQGELILVVDDERSIQEIVQVSLEQYNYRVITASDGIEAIAEYAKRKDEIRAILLDMMMPSLDSVSTILTLQQLNPNVKIIAVSGLATNEAIAKATSTSVKCFLAKPFTAQEILHALQTVLQESPQYNEARTKTIADGS
jgi:two-component system, cell cycle sensor histidine kinase and response regulator CckA